MWDEFFSDDEYLPDLNPNTTNNLYQYPQNVTIFGDCLNVPKIGEVKGVS